MRTLQSLGVRSAVAAAVAVLLGLPATQYAGPLRTIRAGEYLRHVKYLSSDKLRGRATGSNELDQAAAYVARQFEKSGLRPLGGSYFQSFPVSVDSKITGRNELQARLGDETTSLELNSHFLPLPFSGSGTVSGSVAFVGYGITAPEYGYDDYQGLDVRGKIVVVLVHEPNEFQRNSLFEGRIYTEHAQLQSKAFNAKAHGAAAVVLVNDSENHAGPEKLETFVSSVGPADPGLPVVQVRSGEVEKWFVNAPATFRAAQAPIDREEKPRSFLLPDDVRLTLSVSVEHRAKLVNNVVGYLPGTTSEYIVIGAHYDHLGLGEQYSLAPEKVGTAHPGADDNASGTAGLISLARTLSGGPKLRRGVVFVAFAGEELGLLGSSHYVNHPLLPLDQARFMINMDMIGRVGQGKVAVGGAGPDSPFRRLLTSLERKHGVRLDLDDSAVYGSSDHTSFRTKMVPFLFFFSGLHADYHRPSDTWEKVDAKGAARLLNLIAELVSVAEPPSVLRLAGPTQAQPSSTSARGDNP